MVCICRDFWQTYVIYKYIILVTNGKNKIIFHNITTKPQRHKKAVIYFTSLQGSADSGQFEISAGLAHVPVVSCESTRCLSRHVGLLTCLGNQLAEGWSRVVFAEITWVTQPFVFHLSEGLSRHVLTVMARHKSMSGTYEKFFKPLLVLQLLLSIGQSHITELNIKECKNIFYSWWISCKLHGRG